MAFVKLDKFGVPIVFEEPGDSFEGIPVKIEKDCKTQMPGLVDFVRFESADDDDIHSLCVSAALKGYEWENFIEKRDLLKIVFVGEEPSPNYRGKTFKKFELFVDDGLGEPKVAGEAKTKAKSGTTATS
jgi:hypothetical protein